MSAAQAVLEVPAPTSGIRQLVLVGPHGAGKTTLGRRVAAALAWRYDDEIGERLRREALERDAGAHALIAQPDFDAEVFARELERDQVSLPPRVVETWHPGNLAYALERSTALATRMAPVLRAAARRWRSEVLVQPLLIHPATAAARLREPGPTEQLVDWFLAVGERAVTLAANWGLPMAPPIWTDDCSVDEAADLILACLVPARALRCP